MKKIFALVLIATVMLVAAISVSALNIGDVVNKTVYTDIVTKINGSDIASFNIDGYTVVVAEDLRNYGFNVEWRPEERALYITKNENVNMVSSTYEAPVISKSKVGKKANDVLYTDIRTYIEGAPVTSYNIGGQTVIYFNDLGVYSAVSYDDSIRTLSATFPWMRGPVTWYSSSMYRVGIDIPAGDYYAVANSGSSGYYCKYEDSSQDDIEDNDNFSTYTFFRCYDGQYLKLSRCKITAAENAPINRPANGVYKEGTYRVGVDIPAGDYYAVANSGSSGYYCKYEDITKNDIENNDNFNSFTFFRCYDGQYLELSRCSVTTAASAPVNTPADGIYKEGTYRVGVDMPAGEYKMTATSSSGYYCAYTDITYDDIEDNDNFEDVAYYTFKNGQYVEFSRCTAVLLSATPAAPSSPSASNDDLIYVGMDSNSSVARNVKTLKSAIIKNGQRTSGGYGFTQNFGSSRLSLMYLNESNVCAFMLSSSSSDGAEMVTTLYLFENEIPSVTISYGGKFIFVANYQQPSGTMEIIESTVDNDLCLEVVDTAYIAFDEFIDMLAILYSDFDYIDLEDFNLGI